MENATNELFDTAVSLKRPQDQQGVSPFMENTTHALQTNSGNVL